MPETPRTDKASHGADAAHGPAMAIAVAVTTATAKELVHMIISPV